MTDEQMTSIQAFFKTYGPFAFGIASLLILWYSIMKPELESKRLDFESHRRLIEEQSSHIKLLQGNSQVLHDAAKLIESASLRLERLSGTTTK